MNKPKWQAEVDGKEIRVTDEYGLLATVRLDPGRSYEEDCDNTERIVACINRNLLFDLGEHVWLAGRQSYLIRPTAPTDFSNEAWRDVWHVSRQAFPVVGIKLVLGKVWYEFPGGGNDDGGRMYRTRAEAEQRVEKENAIITRKSHE